MNFCPICGKDTEKTFCEEHEEKTLDYKDIVIRVCECKSYFHRSRWLPFQSLKAVVKKIAKDQIKEKVDIDPLTDEEIEKKAIEIQVIHQGNEFIIPAKIIVDKCPTCSKIGTTYFESTLQIRPFNQEVLDFVLNLVEKDDKGFISKFEEKKEGVDLLLSSNKLALQIGTKLKKSFNGELKTSRHIWGRDKQRSRDLYRVTVCFILK